MDLNSIVWWVLTNIHTHIVITNQDEEYFHHSGKFPWPPCQSVSCSPQETIAMICIILEQGVNKLQLSLVKYGLPLVYVNMFYWNKVTYSSHFLFVFCSAAFMAQAKNWVVETQTLWTILGQSVFFGFVSDPAETQPPEQWKNGIAVKIENTFFCSLETFALLIWRIYIYIAKGMKLRAVCFHFKRL